MGTTEWDSLRKQARYLENDIDMKLVAFSKVGSGGGSGNHSGDTSPLLGENIFDNLSEEIEQILEKLAVINEKMSKLSYSGMAQLHTINRHNEILQDYRQEFNKIRSNHTTRIEREELLRGSGITTNTAASGLSRRDMFLKESTHLHNSHNLVNDQINIAMETKEHLTSQRHNLKRLQTRFNDISNRFPIISSLLQRINIRKRRDSLILSLVIAICTILIILYAFH